MMAASPDVAELAARSEEYSPFYAWCYARHGLTREDLLKGRVPAISKRDFYAYEDAVGARYYERPGLDLAALVPSTTSGSTGRALHVMKRRAPDPARGIGRILDHMREKWGVDEQLRLTGIFGNGLKEHWRHCAEKMPWMTFDIVHPTTPREEKEQRILDLRPHVIWDDSNLVVIHLLLRGHDLGKLGVRCVVTAQNLPKIREALHAQGVEYVEVFACMETMEFAMQCGKLRDPPASTFHLVQPYATFEVELPDGSVADHGEGRLLMTHDFNDPPFVRYWNGDIVRLVPTRCECGFEGRDLVFLRREHAIVVPSVDWPPFNYQDAYDALVARHGFDRAFMLYFRAKAAFDREALFLATIIETDVAAPTLDLDLTDEMQRGGIGFVEEDLRPFLPVLKIPRGSLGWEPHAQFESGDLKAFRRSLWDFTKAPLPEELRPLVGQVLELISRRFGANLRLGERPSG